MAAASLPLLRGHEQGYLTPTLNSYGFMIGTEDDAVSLAFLERAVAGKAMDVGTAYGATVLDIMRRRKERYGEQSLVSGTKIVANDLDERHLTVLKSRAEEEFGTTVADATLELLPGSFPDVCLDPAFVERHRESFDCIRIANVFHFFSGEEIERSARALFPLLRPGGTVFVSALTVYTNAYSAFIPTYEKLKNKGVPYPGYITNIRQYFKDIPGMLPDSFHGLDPDILRRVFEGAGYVCSNALFYQRSKFGDHITFDGREACGIEATRPSGAHL